MSDLNTPTPHSETPAPTQAAPASAAPAAPTAPALQPPLTGAPLPSQTDSAKSPRKLPMFLKISIVLLAALTLASISLLFIGDFEGKFERVFSTFALFAVFVLLTAFDTRRQQKSEWYAPVALVANAYILGVLLTVIWMTKFDYFSLLFEIFWKSVFVILVTRLVILCCQLLLNMGAKVSAVVTRFAFVTSAFAVLSGILFTAPVAIDAFDLYIPDVYWKIATAMLILTALGLSITLLLRWSAGSEEREATRAQQRQFANQMPYSAVPAQSFPQVQPLQAAPAPQQTPNLLPWPTFADGRPLPMGPDGQPDFSVLG
ncbi:hypothetical protein [Leucobacter coleopterorum]|uniref:hypothetical protein n=1 Tax=Leucobacter coleopterorum TaxID=2714933 RepID=UPI00197DCBBB|nr:hypothetical protein [Leucobacter coleopterorum]